MANVGLELAYMVVFFENEILYIFSHLDLQNGIQILDTHSKWS